MMGLRSAEFSDSSFISLREPIAIVMAKAPIAGKVNTRLISRGFLDAAGAAEIAASFLRCVVERLCIAFEGRVVVAVSPDESIEWMREFLVADSEDGGDDGEDRSVGVNKGGAIRIIGQGEGGDLGVRMEHVWRQVMRREGAAGGGGGDLPLVFFGIDSPDVSMSVLRDLCASLKAGKIAGDDDGSGDGVFFDIAAGATFDGGYWCLASRGFHPEVLREIEWGGCSVFEDTKNRAAEAGLRFWTLPDWYDVDERGDLRGLVERLNAGGGDGGGDDELALVRLGERIRGILGGWVREAGLDL